MAFPSSVKSVSGIAAITSDDVWAVGTSSNGKAAVAIHWDGATWAQVLTPPMVSKNVGFNSVAAVAPDDVWAVGYTLSFGLQPLVEHWDGTFWSKISVPPLAAKNAALVDVAAVASDDVWAVGFQAVGSKRLPLAAHWDGSAWNFVPVPNGGASNTGLLGVTALGPSDVWAVGYSSKGLGVSTLTEHWNGSVWNIVASSNVGGLDNALASVTASSSTDVFAVGYATEGPKIHPLVEHWDGAAWSVVGVPPTEAAASLLEDAATDPAGGLWAVGMTFDAATGLNRTLVWRWDGASWSMPTSPNVPGDDSRFLSVGIAGASGQVWAGGRPGLMALSCSPALATNIDEGHLSPTSTTPPPSRSMRAPAQTPDTKPSVAATIGRVEAASRLTEGNSALRAGGLSVADRPPAVVAGVPIDVVARDVATEAGIAETTITFGAAIGDANSDGAPDFLLGRHLRPARLYINGGLGSFAEADVGTFGSHDRHECSWLDANGDGHLDIFCAVGADRGTEVKKNELWVQQLDGSFIEEAAQFGVIDPLGRGRRPVALDVNGDGWTDLYIVNRHARADGFPSVDRLYLNQGGAYFVDAPSYGLDLEVGIEASCAVSTDLNADGRSDLAVCGPSTIRLYRNVDGSGFQDVTSAMNAKSHARDVAFVDMNGDGTLDLVAAFKDRVEVRLLVDGVFQPPAYTFQAGGTLAIAVGDVNGDGAPDIYVLRGTDGNITNAADVMLVNAGTGLEFSEFSIPTTTDGHADVVQALDYDGNGLSDFLVLNGAGLVHPGPIQLIAFFPV